MSIDMQRVRECLVSSSIKVCKNEINKYILKNQIFFSLCNYNYLHCELFHFISVKVEVFMSFIFCVLIFLLFCVCSISIACIVYFFLYFLFVCEGRELPKKVVLA